MSHRRQHRSVCGAIGFLAICCSLSQKANANYRGPADNMNLRSLDPYAECCPIGYKSEVRLDDFGKEVVYNHCKVVNCCIGLKEILKLGSNGLTYSMCVRDEGRSMHDLKGLAELARILKRYYGDEPMQKRTRLAFPSNDYY
ncbi:small cardioactive peptides-like [Lineus longissimus]|uniref:small cardioactive peptides-like n=1 Tax=Lineus longissimus TaxID=88925 RepID=UPI002B4CF4B4